MVLEVTVEGWVGSCFRYGSRSVGRRMSNVDRKGGAERPDDHGSSKLETLEEKCISV